MCVCGNSNNSYEINKNPRETVSKRGFLVLFDPFQSILLELSVAEPVPRDNNWVTGHRWIK